MADVKHISGEAGGYLVGRRHSKGGIKAINKSTGQPLEMEGGEVVITRNAVSDPTKRSFNGKLMTNREILSTINQSGGGVAFADGGEVPENIYFDIDEEFEYGGRVYKGRDLPQKMMYGTEVDDILDSALEESMEFEEGGQVVDDTVIDARFVYNATGKSFDNNDAEVWEWIRDEQSRSASQSVLKIRGTLKRTSGDKTSFDNLEATDVSLLSNIPSGSKLTDAISFITEEYRTLLNARKDDATSDKLPISGQVIDSILASFSAKMTPNVAALEGVLIYEPSPIVTEVTQNVEDSDLILIQEYGEWNSVWPKNRNFKGYESLMRTAVKGLPDYAKKDVVLKLRFRILTGQRRTQSIAVVYLPIKLDMRKLKWSEISKLIKDKIASHTQIDTQGGSSSEEYHIVLDNADWKMFESTEYSFANSRANKARGQKVMKAIEDFIEKNKSSGSLSILTQSGLFSPATQVELSKAYYDTDILVGTNVVGSIDNEYLKKADFAIGDSEIILRTPYNNKFFKFYLDSEAVERMRTEREAAEKAERERKAEELRLKKEAEEAEKQRLKELANRPFQVRDQPEDEALFDGELMADNEERRLLLADIEAVKRLLNMAQGQTLADTRVALIKKLKRLEAKKQEMVIYNESMDVEAQKLISPIGLMNYYYTQARQNPTANAGKPSGLPTPTGVPSKLDIQSYYAVRTRYFKRWFGDWELAASTGDYSDCSLIIDPDTKEPRLMYHGVRKYVKGVKTGAMGEGVKRPFGTFKAPNFPATYHGDDINGAKFYAGEAKNMRKPFEDYEGFIYTSFINMRRPIFIDEIGRTSTYADIIAFITIKYGIKITPDPEIMAKSKGIKTKVWNFIREDVNLINQLKKKGFDGIIQIGDVPLFDSNGRVMQNKSYWGTEYLVFEANQVKSATVKKSFYLEFFDDVRFKDGGYVRI